MPRRSAFVDQTFSVADVLNSAVDVGEVLLTLGDVRNGVGIGAGLPMFGIDGFMSRPNAPDVDGAAQAMFLHDGDQKVVMASRDLRFGMQSGEMGEGDRAIVTDGDNRILLKKDGEKVVLVSTNRKAGGKTMLVELSGKDGHVKVMNGGSWLEVTDERVTIGAAGGKAILQLDANGITIRGLHFACLTLGGNLGTMDGNLVPPPAVVQGIAYGPGGPVNLVAPKWTVSPL